MMTSATSSLQMPHAHCGTRSCFSQTFGLHLKCSISAADAEHFCSCVSRQIVSMAVLIILDHSDSQHLPIDIRNENFHLLNIRHSPKPEALAVLPFLLFTRTLNELSRGWLLSCPKLQRSLSFFSDSSRFLKPGSALHAVPFKASRMASRSESGRQGFL